jgi:hypothetical protein
MNSLASAEQQLDQTKNRLYGGQEAQTRQSMKRINEE